MSSSDPIGATVATSNGPVIGLHIDGVHEFRGIPFAGEIGGTGRFQPPTAPPRWASPLLAATWPPQVPQPPDGMAAAEPEYYASVFGGNYQEDSTEDGLYVNVWTPAADDARRPVMVFLHGGGFVSGQATRPRENGRHLSARQDVVVVAPSHRLGVAGYLDLRSRDAGAANVGMLDIVFALIWVRDNIVAFGGDPENVTIFGESGGSLKVATLLAMPAARGLFHKAICQSGAYPLGGIGILAPEESAERADTLLESLGLGDADAAKLRRIPLDELANVQKPDGMSWAPVIDAASLPQSVSDAVASGAAAEVPLLIGTDLHEMRVLAVSRPLPDDEDSLAVSLNGNRALAKHYLDSSDTTPRLAAERAISDQWFRIPSIRFAELKAASGSAPVFMYLFSWMNPRRPDVGATHGMETPFVFDNVGAIDSIRTGDQPQTLATTMSALWAGFARSGVPNAANVPQWPPYDTQDRATMVLETPCRVEADPYGADRRAWDSVDLV